MSWAIKALNNEGFNQTIEEEDIAEPEGDIDLNLDGIREQQEDTPVDDNTFQDFLKLALQ